MKAAPSSCCLCGRPFRTNDWAEWRLEQPTKRVVSAHELCVVDLIERTLYARESGQGELFGVICTAAAGGNERGSD